MPHIGPPTKVIPLKLFLGIVPSSSGEHTGSENANTKPNTLFPYLPFFSARKNLVQPWSAGEQTILDKSIS